MSGECQADVGHAIAALARATEGGDPLGRRLGTAKQTMLARVVIVPGSSVSWNLRFV